MFDSIPRTAWTGPGRTRELMADLVWESGADRVVIPRGFRTDLYSVRFLGKLITPDTAEQQGPAILHDYGYTVQGISRAEADKHLLDAMASVGVGLIRRWLIYAGVRVGGWFAWNRNNHELTTDPRAWLEWHGIYRPEFHGPPAEIDAIEV